MMEGHAVARLMYNVIWMTGARSRGLRFLRRSDHGTRNHEFDHGTQAMVHLQSEYGKATPSEAVRTRA